MSKKYSGKGLKVFKVIQRTKHIKQLEKELSSMEVGIALLQNKISSLKERVYARKYQFKIDPSSNKKLHFAYTFDHTVLDKEQEKQALELIEEKQFYPSYWTNLSDHFITDDEGIFFAILGSDYISGYDHLSIFVPWERIQEIK